VNLRPDRFSRESGTPVHRLRVIPMRWTNKSAVPSTGFMQAWFESDTDSSEGRSTNWGAISGLAISLVVSASFWIGAAMLMERLLK